MNSIGRIEGNKILFLQGPMGGFFQRLDLVFREKGAHTFKIGFNAGDWFFSNKDNYIPYRDKKEKWGNFISSFLENNNIDKLFLFGDCRFYQRIAIEKSRKLGIEIFVFEEGYIRPDFITMERYGVNDFSHISRNRSFYEKLDIGQLKEPEILDTQSRFYRRGWSATTYYVLAGLFHFRYPNYRHHRDLNFASEAFYGIRSALRKYKYKITEREPKKKLSEKEGKNYYLVPLQTHNDFQITEHSDFSSIEEFIETVMNSFAKNAPRNRLLIFKHHPMDRGRKDYTKYINTLSEKLNIGGRAISVHDIHLPTLLKNAIGTVTINSTVGISSLYHHTPTIVLGNAIYDIDGLTCKNIPLDDFWVNYITPDAELFEKFRRYLIDQTQLNGSFYGRFPDQLKISNK